MTINMASVTELDSVTLSQPPCCIEFWPADTNYLVVGTYLLQKDEPVPDAAATSSSTPRPQYREGSLVLLKLDKGKLQIISTLTTDYAILDLHFHPFMVTILTASTSTGALAFYELNYDRGPHPRIEPRFVMRLWAPTTLVTYFSWNPYHRLRLVVSLNTGEVVWVAFDAEAWQSALRGGEEEGVVPVIDVRELSAAAKSVIKLERLYAHDMEAWTVAFSPNGQHVLSGGDDGVVRGHTAANTPAGPDEWADVRAEQFCWVSRNPYGSGVTAVLPLTSSLYLTGSYDEHVRLVQTPEHHGGSGPRQTLAEARLGGGVWRLKLLDTPVPRWEEQYDVLCSCMHAGARIVRLRRNKLGRWAFEVLAEFTRHESMNYGSDFQPGWDGGGEKAFERAVVSTSYYDRLVCAWKLTVP